MDFTEELSPEERDRLIDELAQKVVKKRLETPVVLFLEMHKPVSFLAGQGLVVATPLLAPLFGVDRLTRYSGILNDRTKLEKLISRIEEMAESRERMSDA